MQFQIKNVTRSQNDLMRAIGYMPAYFQKAGEVSIVRQIGRNDYPRFHLYIKGQILLGQGFAGQMQGKDFIFNLHLDQKKPSYEGQTGHSGDYDGPVVEEEADRIKRIIANT